MRCDPAGKDGAFTVRGYPAQLSQCKDGRQHRVEAEFTVAPSRPLFTLIRPDGQSPPHSSGEIKSGWVRLDDVAGCELWTPDAPATRALFALGLADMAPGVAWTQEPLDRDLGITPPDEAG